MIFYLGHVYNKQCTGKSRRNSGISYSLMTHNTVITKLELEAIALQAFMH